jgi:hypothetical protein
VTLTWLAGRLEHVLLPWRQTGDEG